MSSEERSPNLTPEQEETATSSRPRREGNDSLWKRARRTLGSNNLTFLQPTARLAATPASGSGPAAPSKRREQVRHAQRTHRQRTQNYIKTLENEVVRLRKAEADLTGERDDFKQKILALEATIRSANLSLPPGFDDPGTDLGQGSSVSAYDMPATASFATDEFNHERLHVAWPTLSSHDTFSHHQDTSLSPPQTISPHQQYTQQSQQQQQQPLPDSTNALAFNQLSVSEAGSRVPVDQQHAYVPPTDSKSTSGPANTLEVAIDFVLALEHPCMDHLPSSEDPTGADPANHMMMASTPLMLRAPQPEKATKSLANTSWTVSGSIIKELLKLSNSINLEGEITPVEAWHLLSSHPEFCRLDRQAVDVLKKNLVLEVRCCGFGSILDENVFWHFLNQQLLATQGSQANV